MIRARLAEASGTLALAAGLVAYPAAAADKLAPLVAAVGIAGCVLLVLSMAGRWAGLVAWGIAGVGAEYALFLSLRGGSVDPAAPAVAVGLVLAAELAFRSVEREGGRPERRLVVRTALSLGGAAAGAAVIGGLLLVAAGSAGAGLALEAVGVAAAVTAVGLVVRIAAHR